ncbi:MAG: hypothetical protein ACXWJD_06675 [Burkholderiaceae bacterium]
MKNPWAKKNPFMSMWLSGANSILGSMRGHANAEAKRQTTALMKKGTKEMVDIWSGAPASAPAKRTRKKKSR